MEDLTAKQRAHLRGLAHPLVYPGRRGAAVRETGEQQVDVVLHAERVEDPRRHRLGVADLGRRRECVSAGAISGVPGCRNRGFGFFVFHVGLGVPGGQQCLSRFHPVSAAFVDDAVARYRGIVESAHSYCNAKQNEVFERLGRSEPVRLTQAEVATRLSRKVFLALKRHGKLRWMVS